MRGRRPVAAALLALQAAAWLLALRIGLLALPFARVSARVKRMVQRGAAADVACSGGADVDRLRALLRAMKRARYLVPGCRCLCQAMAGQVFLARNGFATELQIGVARDPGQELQAHAWLEHRGRPIFGDPQPGRYQPLEQTGGRIS